MEEYIDSLEDLRSILLQNGHRLNSAYLLQSFIGGLREETEPFVKAFNPTSISDAIRYARLQEEQLKACAEKLTVKSFANKSMSAYKPQQPYTTKTITNTHL